MAMFRIRKWHLGLLAVVFAGNGLRAQSQNTANAMSELAAQNQNAVAASAAPLKVILLGHPGVLLELKKWIAQDATDHGQLINGQDLTDDAVFERLENDTEFRAHATRLVQKYGFLVPEINPDSEMGKQQALVLEERAKLLAQQQEQSATAQAANAQAADAQTTNARPNQAVSGAQNLACKASAQSSCALDQNLNRASAPASPGSQSEPLPENAPTPEFLSPTAPSDQQPAVPTGRNRLQTVDFTQQPYSTVGELAMLGLNAAPGSQPGFDEPSSGLLEDTSINSRAALFQSGASPMADTGSDRTSQTQSPALISGASRPQARASLAPAPTLVRAANPYLDVPSLYDMYLQAVPRPAEPVRFGSEVFASGTRDSQSIPMDLPVGPDYIVGPGDGLTVNVWGGVSQRLFSTVDREGRITLPEVGPVLVDGRSLSDVQKDLEQALKTQFRDTSVDVSLSRLRTIRVYEAGDISNPGAYDISSLSSPLNALFVAGGPTTQGSMRLVKHYRGNQLVEQVDLYDLLLNGVKDGMQRLDNGDTILVPPLGPQVTVEGMVRRPAIYELKNEKTLADVLSLAGGVLPAATLRHIEVERLVAHDRQTMLNLDIPETDDGAISQKLASFEIQDGDRIRIYPIAPYNSDSVYLEGHVLRPGRYSYRPNLRVGDMIATYQDLLPEPATKYAEIIRLEAPDYHPAVRSFDLAAALANPSTSPVLAPMDTVRIFSKYDFENAPTVSVWGEVRKPGTYPTSGQIHLADAVSLAGGLSPDAETEDAQVFRYLPNGQFKIFSVNLSTALEGDPTENIELETRDRVLVHSNQNAVEPATIYIKGEVARPGRYPLTANMTIADLVKVGGGLQPGADAQTADLMHYSYSPGNNQKLEAQHNVIELSAALSSDRASQPLLHNGDVLTIRELPGWNDLGASITLKGEVMHPGSYGIRPGEKLSSVIERAGGFAPGAYPRGSVLQRVQVRDLENKQQDQLILRVKDEEQDIEALPETDARAKQTKQAALQQYQSTLTQLSATPPVGRVALRISERIDRWKNSDADISVSGGDTLTIPKRPDYVMVTGQVFNASAVAFRPGRNAKWYLSQSGGPNALADKKSIFVLRADGSVIGGKQGLLGGDPLKTSLGPGDTVVVPEKAVGGGPNWQNLFTSAQVASSIASTVFIALRY